MLVHPFHRQASKPVRRNLTIVNHFQSCLLFKYKRDKNTLDILFTVYRVHVGICSVSDCAALVKPIVRCSEKGVIVLDVSYMCLTKLAAS